MGGRAAEGTGLENRLKVVPLLTGVAQRLENQGKTCTRRCPICCNIRHSHAHLLTKVLTRQTRARVGVGRAQTPPPAVLRRRAGAWGWGRLCGNERSRRAPDWPWS
jgi:hypothetical protein